MKQDSQQAWAAYQRTLERFHRASNASRCPDWSAPFAPWCGEAYWSTNPRILMVGKAVGASPEHPNHYWRAWLSEWQKTTTMPLEATSHYVETQLRKLNPASHAFWTVPFLIAGALLPPQTPEDKIIDAIAWSNFYKVNSIRKKQNGNGTWEFKYTVPVPPLCSTPSENCICLDCVSANWLLSEIEILQPDVLLLGVGSSWEHIAGYFGLPKKLPYPSIITQNLHALRPKLRKIKSAWLTYHFSEWRQRCEHGTLVLRIRRHLAAINV